MQLKGLQHYTRLSRFLPSCTLSLYPHLKHTSWAYILLSCRAFSTLKFFKRHTISHSLLYLVMAERHIFSSLFSSKVFLNVWAVFRNKIINLPLSKHLPKRAPSYLSNTSTLSIRLKPWSAQCCVCSEMGQGLFSPSGKMFGGFEMLCLEVEKRSLKSSKSRKKGIFIRDTSRISCQYFGDFFQFFIFLYFHKKITLKIKKNEKYTF